MNLTAAASAALAGALLAGVSSGHLHRGAYRLPDDTHRLQLARTVWAVPALAATYAVLTAASHLPQLLPAALLFALAGVWVVCIDLDVHRIPTPLVAVTAVTVAGAAWTGAVLLGEPSRIGTSLAASAALVTGYSARLVRKPGSR